jgi:hypothetical protein
MPLKASGSKSRQLAKVTTIEEVEKSGLWVCAKNSGHPAQTISSWRLSGEFASGEMKLCRVLIPRIAAGTGGESQFSLVRFYLRSAIARIKAKRFADGVVQRLKESEYIKEGDDVLLRLGPAARYLGINVSALHKMSDPFNPHGIGWWGGRLFTTVVRPPVGKGLKYWFLSELDQAKKAQSAFSANPDSAHFSYDEAAAVLGVHPVFLSKKKNQDRWGLKCVQSLNRKVSSRRGADGRNTRYVRVVKTITFEKESVIAASRQLNHQPDGLVHIREASVRLTGHPTQLYRWCNEGLVPFEVHHCRLRGRLSGRGRTGDVYFITPFTEELLRKIIAKVGRLGKVRGYLRKNPISAEAATSSPSAAPLPKVRSSKKSTAGRHPNKDTDKIAEIVGKLKLEKKTGMEIRRALFLAGHTFDDMQVAYYFRLYKKKHPGQFPKLADAHLDREKPT